MDLFELLSLFQGTAGLVPILMALCGVAAWIVATVPAPTEGFLVPVWKVLNVMGANVGRARNREGSTDGIPTVRTKPPDRP